MSAVRDAALEAAERGWHVLPCKEDKSPHTTNGFKEASSDKKQVGEWWDRFPDALIGIHPGASGLVVLDADSTEAWEALEALFESHGDAEVLLRALQATTPRGRHAYFRHPGIGEIGNSSRGLPPGVDIRADKGYVIAPPGADRRFLNPGADPPVLPVWVVAARVAEDKAEMLAYAELEQFPQLLREDADAVEVRAARLKAVRSAPYGTRNNTLNTAAYHLGHLVATGKLDAQETNRLLTEAASEVDPHDDRIPGTIRSGMTAGAAGRPLEPRGPDLEVALGPLLDDVSAFARRFLVLQSDHEFVALSLWVLHTWAIEAAYVTPYLVITSPEAESGKSRMLDVLGLLAFNPWTVIRPSEPVFYRKIDKAPVTLLLDEVDSIFGGNNEQEGLRAALNSGYRRGTTVPRCSGKNFEEITEFKVFCAKALAGIGQPPDTVRTRQIPIAMRKKAPQDHVEDFMEWELAEEVKPLRKQLEAWAAAATAELAAAGRPDAPGGLTDRQKDIWRPLFIIADTAGAEWPTASREAAVALHGGAELVQSDGVLLLQHIRELFEERRHDLTSEEIIRALITRDDGPWADWWERAAIDGRMQGPQTKLSRLLKPFGVKAKRLGHPSTKRGYGHDQFADAWRRYLVPPQAAAPAAGAAVQVTPTRDAAPAAPAAPFQGTGPPPNCPECNKEPGSHWGWCSRGD